MSTSTTCKVYWTNIDNAVTEVDSVKSSCDSTLTSCTIYGSNGASEAVKCNSQLMQSSSTNYKYAQYFCTCGSKAVSVPSIVNCADKCYDMHTNLRCNYVTLSTGFTVGSPANSILQDQCLNFRCTQDGTKCTDDGTLEWTCDNNQYNAAGATSTKSYVCNCNGAAKIPSIYQSNGQTTGKGCAGGSVVSSASTHSVSVHTTTGPALQSTSIPIVTSTSIVATTSSRGGAPYQHVEPGFGLLMTLLLFFGRF